MDVALVSKAEESYSITSQTLSKQPGEQAGPVCFHRRSFTPAAMVINNFFFLKLARSALLWRAYWSQVNHTAKATQQSQAWMLETAARSGKGGQQSTAKSQKANSYFRRQRAVKPFLQTAHYKVHIKVSLLTNHCKSLHSMHTSWTQREREGERCVATAITMYVIFITGKQDNFDNKD